MKRALLRVAGASLGVEFADEALYRQAKPFLRFARAGKAEEILSLPAGSGTGEAVADAVVRDAVRRARRRGWGCLHSGAAAGRKGAALFVGRSFSGKSTLSLYLASRGHRLLSDELNVLKRERGRLVVAGFPLVPQARAAALANVPGLSKRKPRLTRTPRDKWLVPSRPGAEAPLSAVIFVSWKRSGSFSLEPVGPDALGAELARHTGGYLADAPDAGLLDYVLSLRALAREGRVFSGVWSDRSLAAFARRVEKDFLGAPGKLKRPRRNGIVAG